MWFPFFLLLHYTHLQYVVINTHPFNTFTIKSLFILAVSLSPSISLLCECEDESLFVMHECQFHEKCFIEEKIVFLLNNFHLFNCILEAYIRCWYSISTTFINSQLAVWKFIFTLHNIFVSAFCQVSLFLKRKKCQSQTSSLLVFIFTKKNH